MITVPKLRRDEQILALDRSLLEQLLQTFAYALLIAIRRGSFNVLQAYKAKSAHACRYMPESCWQSKCIPESLHALLPVPP